MDIGLSVNRMAVHGRRGVFVLALLALGRVSSWSANFGEAKLNVTVVQAELLSMVHSPVSEVYYSDYLVVPVSITAPVGNGVSDAALFFRQKGKTDYVVAQGSNDFVPSPTGRRSYSGRAIIPGSYLTGSGVEYYIVATDINGISTFHGTPQSPHSSRLAGSGLVTGAPYAFDLGAEGGDMILPDGDVTDGNTSLSLGAGALSDIFTFVITEKNSGDPSQVPSSSGKAVGNAAVAYEFSGGPSSLSQPVKIVLHYADVDGTPGMVDGTAVVETSLRLFFWDGAVWKLVGGALDPALNTVSAVVPRLGLYALFPISDFSSKIFTPVEKVFTPNGDGRNDKVLFSGLTGDFEIRIFDGAGHLVRTIRDVPEWDGRDSSGRLVDNGVYLYQFRSDLSDEWISGLTAVAK